MIEGVFPQVEDVIQHRHVQALLVTEVVVQVGLGQPHALGDGVHAGALEPVQGEFFLGGGKDGGHILLADAAGGLGELFGGGSEFFHGPRRGMTGGA